MYLIMDSNSLPMYDVRLQLPGSYFAYFFENWIHYVSSSLVELYTQFTNLLIIFMSAGSLVSSRMFFKHVDVIPTPSGALCLFSVFVFKFTHVWSPVMFFNDFSLLRMNIVIISTMSSCILTLKRKGCLEYFS